MTRILSLLIIAAFTFVGCEKSEEMGEALFCTNAAIINCPFSIEISIDNRIVDTLSAASAYASSKCECSESFFIGTLIIVEEGEHTYYAKDLNCQGTNAVNEWSGGFEITTSECEIVNLDVL